MAQSTYGRYMIAYANLVNFVVYLIFLVIPRNILKDFSNIYKKYLGILNTVHVVVINLANYKCVILTYFQRSSHIILCV